MKIVVVRKIGLKFERPYLNQTDMFKFFLMSQQYKLTLEQLEILKNKGYRSVIAFGASNPLEIKDKSSHHPLLASKELVLEQRITQDSYHVSIDDDDLKELCGDQSTYLIIEVPE